MDNVKNDAYYIAAIISDLKLIRKNTENVSKAELEKNTVLCDSVLFRIIQVSENTSRLSDQFKAERPDIPWRAIKGMRNRIVHNYGEVDIEIVYSTVHDDIPKLIMMLEKAG